jgi:ABC-type antimicrobial peptide transport system permease subunit
MRWRDAISLVGRGLQRRAGRSALTIAAVALATTLLTALVTIAGTAQDRVLAQVSTGGPLAGIKVAAAQPDPSQVSQDNARPGPPKPLDDAALQRIRTLKDVQAAYPVVAVPVVVLAPEQIKVPGVTTTTSSTTTIPRAASSATTATTATTAHGNASANGIASAGRVTSASGSQSNGGATAAGGATTSTVPVTTVSSTSTSTSSSTTTTVPAPVPGAGPDQPYGDSLVGIPIAQAAQLPVTVVAGRLPTPGSLTEVAVTPDFLDRLHLTPKQGPAVIGNEVEIGFPRAFRRGSSRSRWLHPVIVGVVAQDAGAGQFVGSIQLAAFGRDWIQASGPQQAADFGLQATTYTGVFVIADRLDKVATVRNRITAVGYATSAPEQLIASVKRYLRVIEIVLAAVGVIALVVAALGIANAMLAAVRERRREIGVMKAIGARDADVLRVFLVEALAVGFVGGAMGCALGVGVAALVGAAVNRYLASQGVGGVTLAVHPLVLVGAVLGSSILAMLAGIFPARKAARLPAREAVAGA